MIARRYIFSLEAKLKSNSDKDFWSYFNEVLVSIRSGLAFN